jgi:hypothetical protein
MDGLSNCGLQLVTVLMFHAVRPDLPAKPVARAKTAQVLKKDMLKFVDEEGGGPVNTNEGL